MQSTSSLERIIYKTLEWIMNLSLINLLWVIFNLPVILFLTSVFIKEINIIIILFIMIVLLISFLFPATSAMYASVRECVIYPNSRASINKYWDYYKVNYIRSIKIGGLLVPVWSLWYFNTFHVLVEASNIFIISFLFIGVIYFVYSVNIFIINVHYFYSYSELLINSVYISFGNIKLFLLIIIGSIFVISISFLITKTFFMLFAFFFTGSLFSLISFLVFYKYYLKYSNENFK